MLGDYCMIRKIIALLIVFIFSVQFLVIADSKSSSLNEPFDENIMLLNGIGIMSIDKPEIQNNKVLRDEFAKIINGIVMYKEKKQKGVDTAEWKKEFYGTVPTELKEAQKQDDERFIDVIKGYSNYEYINNVVCLGLMNGTSKDTFEPEREISYIEALKTFIILLGYKPKAELYGDYPSGYLFIASNLKLSINGLKQDQIITYRDLSKLITLALNVELLNTGKINSLNISYITNKNETLLTKILGLNKITGCMTDNGITSFFGRSQFSGGNVCIENNILKTGNSTAYCKDFIGRNVECYYTNEESENEGVIVYARVSGKDDVITFSISDFRTIDKNSVSYFANDKMFDVKLESGYKAILNGLAIGAIDRNTFDYENGSVTLVRSAGNSLYDLIIIEGYESCYVNAIDEQSKTIYNKLHTTGRQNLSVVLDNNTNVSIFDNKGNLVEFSYITVGSVLDVSKNEDVIKIIVTNKSVENITIKEYSVEGDKTNISDGAETYTVSRAFLQSDNTFEIKLGDTFNAFLNSFNDIVWFESGNISDWNLGYLHIIGTTPGLSTAVEVKIFTADSIWKIFALKSKIKFSDNLDVNYDLTDKQLYTKLKNSLNELIRYKLTKENFICDIELPLDIGVATSKIDRLQKIFMTDDTTKQNYMHNGVSFGSQGFLDSTTKVFTIPKDKTSEDLYNIASSSLFKNQDTYAWISYGLNQSSLLAKYFLVDMDSTSVLNYETPFLIVTKIVSVIGPNSSECYKINGFSFGKSFELICEKEKMEYITNPMKEPNKNYVVTAGDILRYTTDANGLVNYFEVVFKADEVNHLNPLAKKGWLAGSKGFYEGIPTQLNNNPYTVTDTGVLNSNITYGQQSGSKMIYGYVYNAKDNIITVTTQNLQIQAYDKNQGAGIYITENYKLHDWYYANKYGYVDLDGKSIKADKLHFSKIKSFKEFGSNCSRVLIISNYGVIRDMVVIDGYIQ